MPGPVPEPSRRDLRLLQLGTLTSAVDRFTFPPAILAIAADLDASLAEVSAGASAYFLLYGLTQPAWAMVSDRLGRVRTIRLTLVGAAVAGLLSAAAPTLLLLVVARAFAGALFAAVVPTAMVYVGDMVPPQRRHRALAALFAGAATGGAIGTVGAGVAASSLSWRWAFVVPAVAALAVSLSMRRLPEAPRSDRAGVGATFGRVLSHRWAVLVLGLSLVEGVVLLGPFTFLAPAVESGGSSARTAGLVVAMYGVGVVTGTPVVSRLSARVQPALLVLLGGAQVAVAFALASASSAPAAMAVVAFLLGTGFVSLHTTLQAWVVDVTPQARAAAVSLFAALLFLGSSLGTVLLAPFADAGDYRSLYLIAVAAAVPFALVAAVGRRGYSGRRIPAADVPEAVT